jgi:carboxypeptidase PM20D1
MLMAHQDVVPVDEGDWQHPPFAGEIADGVLWGRGVLDDKGALFAILEAVELLLAEGFTPERTLYIFFGHDEELGGPDGAVRAGELLESRGLDLAWVLDEGGFIISREGTGPIALVGIAEKGSVTYTLSLDEPGGHSSVPPRHTAIGTLAEAITRLEASPMPGGIDGLTEESLLAMAPQLPFGVRAALANLWLFGPLVEAVMAGNPALDAMQRTTTAVTMVSGGVKSNVLPSHAEATVNFRIRPGDTAQSIREHIRKAIDNDDIEIRKGAHREASPVSPTDSEAFAFLSRTIREIFPEAAVAPYTVVGGTDARSFYRVTPNVYRFNPFRVEIGATSLVHGTDERMEIAKLGDAIRFYARLIEKSGGD